MAIHQVKHVAMNVEKKAEHEVKEEREKNKSRRDCRAAREKKPGEGETKQKNHKSSSIDNNDEVGEKRMH